MKLFLLLVAAAFTCVLAGCPATMQTTVSPGQQTLNTTSDACKKIDAAIVAADQAVQAKVLKGTDARNAVKGLTAAQSGCVAALASIQAANTAPPTPAASGATQ